ncbi:MAG: hypothetical protein ACK41E_12145, partial [Deinococcales bacterium]
MKILYSSDHRLHHPKYEFLDGRMQPYFENPERLEILCAALIPNHTLLEPSTHTALESTLQSIHDPGYLEWLETGFARYRAINPNDNDVLPCTFAVRGLSGFDSK